MRLTNTLRASEGGSALMCVLGVLTVLSLVAANVLMNCTTRYNGTSKQIKGWKESLIAAEAGADLAFTEVRKNGIVADPNNPPADPGFLAANNWGSPAPSPLPAANSWELGWTKAGPTLGEYNSLSAKVTVDKFQMLPGSTTVGYYRIRSIGKAIISGLKRTGMDNRVDGVTKGDNLLRKLDFTNQHFWSTFGFGDALPTDAATAGNGKKTIAVSDPNRAEVSRRIELVAVPIMPIEGAVKTSGSYSFPTLDSFDSLYGPYPGPTPSAAPFNTASGQASVVDGSSSFSAVIVYGDVSTNGGSASANGGGITGVIDNNVPVAPVSNMAYTPGVYETLPNGNTITPLARAISSVIPINNQQQTTFWYHYTTSPSSTVTVNPAPALYATAMPTPVPAGTPYPSVVETTINLVIDGDVKAITVNRGVKLNIYFTGNVTGKGSDYTNNNVDGPGGNGVFAETSRTVVDGLTTAGSTTLTSSSANFSAADVGDPVTGAGIPAGATIVSIAPTYAVLSKPATVTGTGVNLKIGNYSVSTDCSRANHLWFYGEGTNQTISFAPGGPTTVYAGYYAPNADWSANGNPDFVGAAVVRSFYGNGGDDFHFDKQMLRAAIPLDYRVASYIEDVR